MNLRNLAVAALLATTATAAQQPFDLDPSFRLPVDEININSVLQRPDGKLIVSGQLRFPGVMAPSIGGGVLNTDGTVETYLTPDGHYYLLGGRMTPWGDGFYVGRSGMRYHWDGTMDTTWQPTGVILVQDGDYQLFPDGRVLVTGYGHIYGVPSLLVGPYAGFWLRSDGHVDTTRTPISAEGPIFTIRQMPDGKFMCTGGGGFVQGHPSPTIFRLNPDGSLDTTFQAPYLELGYGYDYVPAQDGKVLAAGYFKFIGSPDTLSLVRFLPDGPLDSTFNAPYCTKHYGISNFPMIMQVTPFDNDKMIVTGGFDKINGEVRGGIAMLDTSGTLVEGYFGGAGCGGYPDDIGTWRQYIYGFYTAPDGYFYIFGGYHGYDDDTGTDGSNQRLISRLYGLNVGIQEHHTGQVGQLHIAPNPGNGQAVELSLAPTAGSASRDPAGGVMAQAAEVTVHDASGRAVQQEPWPAGTYMHTRRAGLLAPGTYMVRVVSSDAATAGSAARDPAGGYVGQLVVLP